MNTRDQDIMDAEQESVDLTIYSEAACTHCRTAKEINCENSRLSDAVKMKILVAAKNKHDEDRRYGVDTQIMAFVGTYTCYTAATKATYMEISLNGYKLRMIKNIHTL